jgi:hypothetical protein
MTNGAGSSGTTTMIVEVAADAAFATILSSKPVAAGPNGRSSVTLDKLNASTTFYWRIRTTAGADSSVVSTSSSFRIGPQEAIGSPTAVQPLANSFPHERPAFTVKNVIRTGASTPLSYRFEIGPDAGFANVVATGTVAEGADVTTFVPGADLVPGSTYFWRARASDPSTGVSGDYSSGQSFTTVFPEDGSSRYELVLHVPSYCADHSTTPPIGYRYFTYFLGPIGSGDISYDGMLVIERDTLQYRFSDDRGRVSDYTPPGEFSLSRVTNELAGKTSACVGQGFFLSCIDGTLSGRSDNQGRFSGALSGATMALREGIPGVGASYCAFTGFGWTLSPR